jgi:chromosome segregation ATPase
MSSRTGFSLANPLYYPATVAVAAIVLVLGVRGLSLSPWLMLPAASGVAILGASLLKSRQTSEVALDNPALEQELRAARQQTQQLAEQADALRQEAGRLLTSADQLDLLATVEYACDRVGELPLKLEQLARQFQGRDSLLSVEQLQNQIQQVKRRYNGSTGIAREHLAQLASSLERNLQLARQGQDARQAQVVSVSTLVADAAGTLQQLQNRLRTANLANDAERAELRTLSEALSSTQENVDLLVSQTGG